MDESAEEKWVVLHCGEDDSHVLIVASDVVCLSELPEENEEVQFSYPGSKKLLVGTVKAVSADYDELRKVMGRLNSDTKPRREPSFHENEKRLAAKKGMARGFRELAGMRAPTASTRNEQASLKRKEPPQPSSKSAVKIIKKLPAENKPSRPVPDKAVRKTLVSPPKVRQISAFDSTCSSEEEDQAAKHTESDETVKKFCFTPKTLVTNPVCSPPGQGISLGTSKDNPSKSAGNDSASKIKPREKIYTSSSSDDEEKNSRHKEADEFLFGDCDGNIDQTADSSSGSELDEAARELMAKLAKKSKYKDMFNLLNLTKDSKLKIIQVDAAEKAATTPVPENKTAKTNNGVEKPSACETHEELKKTTSENPVKQPAGSDEKSSSGGRQKQAKSHSKRRKRSNEAATKEFVFSGEFFRHKADDAKVEKVSPDFDVFITQADLREVKKRWHTPTAIARAVARKIFTPEALQICSVSGKIKVQRDGMSERRTALHKDGMDAILDFVDKRCAKKNWRRPEDSILRQAINNMLYEEREKQIQD